MDPDQTAPLGAVWSGSTLFAYMQKSMFEKFARRCSRRHKQTTFSDAGFLGALRVKFNSCLLLENLCFCIQTSQNSLCIHAVWPVNFTHIYSPYTPEQFIALGKRNIQGPVVQSVISLTSSLRVILLTVLADSLYNILIFFAEKMWKATHIFSAKNFSIFAYHSM